MNLQEFRFDTSIVRTTLKEGQVWFVLADVCKALGIANARDAATRLDEDEKADVGLTDTSSNGVAQKRQFTIINESGLYAVILTSRKPEARPFRKWVTSEVLPSIRQTGSYTVQGGSTLHALESRVADLEAVVTRLTGKRTRKPLNALPHADTVLALWREHIGTREVKASEAAAILLPHLPVRFQGRDAVHTASILGKTLTRIPQLDKHRTNTGAHYVLREVA